MEKAIKYLAASIGLATIVLACLYRYEFDRAGTVRNDRWTGRSEMECSGNGWMTYHECQGLRAKQQFVPIQ